MIKTSIKGVIPFVQKKDDVHVLVAGEIFVFFFQKSGEKSLKILLNMQRQRLLSLWRKAVCCTAGADKHADVYTICGELSITPLLHRWALSFALQVRRCYLNIAPAQLCDKLVRPCHKHSTRGNNTSLCPFRSSSLSGSVSFTNRSPILWNALQSVSGSEISTFSQSRFKKSFLDLLLVYPKFISFTVGDINSCV